MAMHIHHPTRRDLLRDAAALAGAALFPARLVAQDTLSAPLTPRTFAIHTQDATVLAADTDEGIILVDGGRTEASLAVAESHFPGKPVRALFNTHWHEEQTGANRALGERGVEIVAHENTKLWLGTEVWVRWSDKKYPPLPKAALPTTTVYDPGRMTFGGRVVEYGWARDAHTDGDLFIFFPDDNVLVTGGFVSNTTWPVIDWWTGGWTVGMLNGFDRLLEVANERTRIVPAVGPMMSYAQLKAQRAMYLKIFDRIHGSLIKALGVDEVLATKPTAEFDAQYGDPKQFVTLALQSTWGHLRDAHDTRLRNIA